MPAAPLDLAARARGTLLGALAGGGGAPLLEVLAEELAEGRTDLRRLAERWVERSEREEVGDPETAAALAFIAAHQAPPTSGGSGSGALGRQAPVVLVAYRSPRTLVSATLHIAALTHPAPETAWGAVAVNVALGRLLEGRRDFIADVIAVLTGNDAPEPLLEAVRRVPRQRRNTLPGAAVAEVDAVAGIELVLGLAYHEPIAARGLETLRRAGASGVGAAAGALLGARGGEAPLPAEWLPEPQRARWSALAERLVRLIPAATGHSRPLD
jgi:ADP-ribosylglycohydrolase